MGKITLYYTFNYEEIDDNECKGVIVLLLLKIATSKNITKKEIIDYIKTLSIKEFKEMTDDEIYDDAIVESGIHIIIEMQNLMNNSEQEYECCLTDKEFIIKSI